MVDATQISAAEPRGADAPLLSIGVPVYNGERFLREALDSLLGQDVADLELIISDNCSSDGTEAICNEYARDPRVRYTRVPENVGAAANYNRVFELARGRYFMWGSDDDIWDPRFASACIRRLESSPCAVQCTSAIELIAENGQPLSEQGYRVMDTEGMPVQARAHEVVARMAWYEIYSVFRPEALRRTHLYRETFGGDVCLLMELALLGECVMVPDALVRYRLPATAKTADDLVEEIAPGLAGERALAERSEPWTCLAQSLVRVVRESNLAEGDRIQIEQLIARTLSVENLEWRAVILRENSLNEEALLRDGSMVTSLCTRLGIDPAAIPDELVPRGPAWRMREGMRLRGVRRALLKLLQPFADSQNEANGRRADAAEKALLELSMLRHRVDALERTGESGRKCDGQDDPRA